MRSPPKTLDLRCDLTKDSVSRHRFNVSCELEMALRHAKTSKTSKTFEDFRDLALELGAADQAAPGVGNSSPDRRALELKRQHNLTGHEVEQVEIEIFDVAFHIIGGGEQVWR